MVHVKSLFYSYVLLRDRVRVGANFRDVLPEQEGIFLVSLRVYCNIPALGSGSYKQVGVLFWIF